MKAGSRRATLRRLVASALLAMASAVSAQDWTGARPDDSSPGAAVWRDNCASCHATGAERAPAQRYLADMTPSTIHRALTQGVMRAQGEALSADQKIAVAEYLTGRKLVAAAAAPANRCTGYAARFDFNEPPAFTGWGLDPASTHAIATEAAGLSRANVGRLKLKWAYGFADSSRVRSHPALAGGAILIGAHDGSVVALDRATGCERWRFAADAEVRTAIVVGPWRKGDARARPLAWFGDVVGNVYAIDARTGAPVWKIAADSHPATTITGAPTLHGNTLYVPVSSLEEASAFTAGYACCSFRGSVVALDARTGRERWRTWLVGKAKVQSATPAGVDRLGPSGVAVWNSPAIDLRRGQLIVATGDNYSQPDTELSDSVVAMDLRTGRIRWHYQATARDAWNVACIQPGNPNCPEDAGPDFDFGAGTLIAKGANGREYVLAGQKSGWAYALDPATGKLAWKTRVGAGGMAGGIYFGMAAQGGRLYVPVSDRPDGKDHGMPPQPGLYALDIATGQFAWKAPSANVCPPGNRACVPGLGGAISATPELVLAGSDDGHMRIHDAASGAVLWDIDTTRDWPTVNGVPAKGGAISGGVAPIAWQGQLIVPSGYGFGSKLPGNALLVFEAE
jgi:polyvinyl alcohol dehydrogenase (cytochrome)